MRGFKGDLKAFCIETPHKVRNKMEKAFSNKHHMHFLSFKKSFRFVAKVTLKMLLSHLSLFQMPTNHPPFNVETEAGDPERNNIRQASEPKLERTRTLNIITCRWKQVNGWRTF